MYFKSNTTELQISYDKLNHGNFQYRFSVYLYSRRHNKVQANVRIFLIPKTEISRKQPLAILLDKYRVNLKRGWNTVRRHDIESSTTGGNQRSLIELQEYLNDNNSDAHEKRHSGCGWPPNFLLPRGAPNRAEFTLVVMFNKVLEEDRNVRVDLKENTGCGSPDGRAFDSRPFGFPFDRPVSWDMKERNFFNWMYIPVKIFHRDT